MNKNRYRVIYSQARGMFVAVAEIVKSRTKTAGQSSANGATELESEDDVSNITYKKLNPLNFSIISLLGAVIYTIPMSSIGNTQIITDKTAPTSQQATILNTSNGITQVNIQTPSAGGVSRNTYKQFDVGQEGVILNNSRNNVQTQIGGWVQGNPWLAKGEAKVILNEVNSSNPSQLKGYLEVAGKSAQVVIANPSGLVCDGCGVINADRFTLTTGQAVMNQGYLESFRVREGQVTIEGKGLNGSLTPYTDVYARALKVNAGLYANELHTVLGPNDIQVKDQVQPNVTPISGSNNANSNTITPQPDFALDVGQLGGMYAGKIYLVGTEQGLGVRNAGSINATAAQMTLNANGDLVNTGNIIANTDQIAIQAQNVKNSGNISSTQHQIHIQANDIQNKGLVATNDQIKLEALGKINNNDGVINAGRIDFTAQNLSNDKGKIEQTGSQQLNITAKALDNSQGLIGQASKESIGATLPGENTQPTVTDPQDQSSAQDSSSIEIVDPATLTPKTFEAGQVKIAQDMSNITGHIINNADISLKVQDSIKNNGGKIQLPELQFNGQNFENKEGQLIAKVINITAQNADNQKGLIDALESVDLNIQQLNNNQGRLQSTKTLNLSSNQIDNSTGHILANDTLILNSEQTNNTEGVIASVNADAQLKITALENNKGEISAQNVQLNGQTLNNHQGTIQSKVGDLTLKVDQIDNGITQDLAGNLVAGKNLSITAQQLNSTGQIYAGDTADLTVKQLQQDGQLAARNKIKVQSYSISSKQNAIWAAGLDQDGKLSQNDATLNINAQNLQIAGRVLSGSEIQIDAAQSADLSLSENQAKNIKIQTQQLKTGSAKLIADQQLDLTAAQNIDNQKGQYSANQINIHTNHLNNDQGLIQHTGQNDFTLNIADRIDNNTGKIISNANNTEIKTTSLNSNAGEILHAGNQQLKITAQSLQGQQGTIQSNSKLQLELGATNLDNATTTAQNINLNAISLSHQQGRLIQSDANGQLNVNVEQVLDNTSGVISAAGHAKIKTADLNNQQGVIQSLAQKDLMVDSKTVENASGKIIAGRDANLHVSQLNNDTGTVYADGKLDLQVEQNVSNQQGLIAAKQALSIKGQELNNQKGQIQSEQSDVSLNLTKTINNQSGNIQSGQALNIQSPNLNNKNGQLISGADSQLNVSDLNNQVGTIYSKTKLDVSVSATADNSAGIIAAEQNLNLNAQQLLNDAGQIRSENADAMLNVAQNITNNMGLISAGKDLNLTAQDVQSQKGKLQSGANAQIKVRNLDNTEGVVYAAEQLQLNATGELNNSKGVVAAEQLTDITASTVKNDAGQIRSQQDQLKLNVENELSNLAGEISANKAIELTANTLSNQNGKVIAGTSLHATTQQIDNTTGTIYARDQLNLNVADQLNNQSGTIAANQQVQIQAKNLNNNAGKIRSEQNLLDLNVQQTLDNQSGEIFAGTNAKVNTIKLNNQQGTIYAKNQIDLTAGELNNQQGQVYSADSATVTVKGDIQNQKGVLVAEQNLNVQSQKLDNTEGTLRSEKADLTLNAQGQLINQQGDIYAEQNASLTTQSLVNTAGQIASKNQLNIDTRQQQLNNQNGKIITKTVDLKTGTLDNQTGLIQGEQSVKIDTQNHALLNNNSGDQAGILSHGRLVIANVSQLDNISGYIAAVGSANITTQHTNNNQGKINSQSNLTISQQSSGGRIDNLAGQIQAQKNVNLNVDTLNNSGVASHIVAGEKLTVNTQTLLNAQTKDSTVLGGLDAKNIEIDAQELDNQFGAIRASENATLNIQKQMSNQSGSISSLDSLSIGTLNKTLNVNNMGGELLAKNQLNLKANELINKGKMISEGNVDIDIKQSYTHTQDDQIAANGTLKFNTDNDLINQSELTAGQKLELSAKNIKNESGASISSNETHLTAQDTVHNQGLINGELTHIQADRVWNDGARIYGTQVSIQAKTLDNKSNTAGTGAVIASRGDMDLGIVTLNNQSGGVVKESARDNAWIFSSGDLNIGESLDGNLKAQGQANVINNLSARIESLGDMTLTAKNINNINMNFKVDEFQVGGVENKVYIQPDGKMTKIPAENLIWRNWSRAGLYKYDTTPNTLPENVILGETPIPNVESINCVGTGDDESCNVNYKKDDPVWAYFKVMPPSKDAPTAPNMVEPVPPTGQASCEAGAGYDAVACTAYQTAHDQYEKDKETYEQGLEQYKKDLDAWSEADESTYQTLSDAIEAYNGKFSNSEFKKWTQYEVKETKFKSEVINSAPAEIIAGGDINLYGDAFTNDKSLVLAGKKLNVQIAKENLNHIDGKGVEIIKQTGTSQYTYSKWRGGFKRYHQRKWGDKVTYNPADEVTEIDLPVNQWLGNVKNHTSNQNISKVTAGTAVSNATGGEAPDQQIDRQQQGQSNQVTVDGGQSLSVNGRTADVPNSPDQLDVKSQNDQNIEAEQQQVKSVDTAKNLQAGDTNTSATKGQGEIEIRSVSMDFMSLPSNALFSTTKDSQAKFLVETDPAFSNYKNWLSSDYMLDAMELDPATKQKRLGDGYYEQRLIQDQIAQLTGQRFLQGYGNDEEQYKSLMNNALSFAKLYNLRPGIALTAAQIAQLTTDIVWLEEKAVKLADGTTTKALVPQVYVKARVGDLKGDGTLISADQVKIQVKGNVLNNATIAGREAIQISADNINQLNGRMQANQIDLKTTKDLNNIGGTITAVESASLNIGGNFNQTSTTQTTVNKIGASEFTREGFDRKAGIYVTGAPLTQISNNTENLSTTLTIRVGGDTTLKGSEIVNNNGSSAIKTEGNLNIGGVNTSINNRGYANKDNFNYEKKQEDIGSVIQSVGDTRLQAENITVKGSQISSEQGSTILSAQQNIDISEGRKLSDTEQAFKVKEKSTFSKTVRQGYVRNMSDEAIASTIDGKNVILDANNIDIRGSSVVSDELTQIQAKEKIKISAAENQYANEAEYSIKKSGFTSSFSDGVASVGYGKSNIKHDNKSQSTSLTQSLVSSVNGNTNIIAGQDLNAVASIIEAGKDINLIGKNVHLDAADVQQDTQSKFESKSSGVSIGFTYSGVAAAAASAKKSQDNNDFSDSAVGKIMSSAETVRKATMAATTPVVFQAHKQKMTKTKDTSSTQSVDTEVKAGGNLNIIATEGDIRSQGAKISAEGDALLHAKNNVDLLAAQNTESQTADSKRKGFSVDNRDHIAPLGVYNDKEKANGGLVQSVGTELSVGGKTTIKADDGSINIVGSKVVSTNDLVLNAGKDVNIKSAQNSFNQSEDKKSKGWGSAQISDTERFDGYMANQNKANNESVSQERSQVGSLDGSVNINAGNNYNQKVADVVAGKDINITAKNISIVDDHNTGSDSQSSKDLKVGVFSRITSPLLDLINAVDNAGKSKADDRTQALQGLAAGAQAYQTANTINNVQKDIAALAQNSDAVTSKAALFKAEAGLGFSTSKNNQDNSYSASQGNVLNAGGNINLTSTEGDIHLKNTQVNANDKISLDAAKDILLESGQSKEYADGKNSNAGAQVGVGVSVGAQTGVYVYAEAGYGKGSNHLESTTHNNTTLNADQISIKSQGDTTLKGAQATANRIDADVGGNLNIISQQDTLEQKNKQMGVGARVQVSAGTAWDASGNFNNSSAKGNSKSVNEQSGLFAGDGGYHVKADHVDLQSGAIASTASKENNDLTADSLTFSNIENESSHNATTVALSGGTRFGEEKGKDSTGAEYTNNVNWRDSTTFSPTLPQQDKDSDSSTTYATISEGNISIGGKDTTVENLGIHSDINTANQKVDALPDLQAILDKQKIVSDATSTIVAATRTYSQNKQAEAEAQKQAAEAQALEKLKAEGGADWEKYNSTDDYVTKQNLLKNALPAYKDASDQAQTWGMGGNSSRALNAVTTAITTALGGQTDLQVVTNTLAPYAAQVIGQEFGHGEDKNTAAQLVSHAILGATLAYINGGDPTAGGSAAVASEAAAIYLTNQYKNDPRYQDINGEFQPNLLPENVKAQIRDLTAGIGAVIGGAAGDSSYNAQLAGVIGQNAVESNALLFDDLREKSKDFFISLSSKAKHPIDQGAIKGVGSIADGLLLIADAFGDTAVSAIHCPIGGSACADAMENNRQKGQAIIDFFKINNLKSQAAAIEQSYIDLASGDPLKVANAQRVQAEIYTSLGLSAAGTKALSSIKDMNIQGKTKQVDVRFNDPNKYKADLAKQSGIPKYINLSEPKGVYGLDSQKLKTYFEMNGYRVNVEKDAPKGSGNAQVYSVYDHKEIGKVQHSPSTANLPTKQQSQHIGEYIKFTLKDGKVDAYGNTKVYIINPNTFKGTAKRSTFYNQQGQKLEYTNGKYVKVN